MLRKKAQSEKPVSRGRIFSRRRFFATVLGLPAAITGHALGIEPGWLRVERIRLNENAKYRFVHFTDVHHKGDAPLLERVVAKINEQKPDFVCFTGDLVEESRFAAEALNILQKTKAPLYGIPGNHDFWADMDFDLAREAFAKTGGQWLMDEALTICGGAVRLFGMSATEGSNFTATSGAKNILLTHYPSSIESVSNTRFDLALAGHSHGGQVRLPYYGALIVPFGVGEYQLGMYETPIGPLYVNAGIGYFYMNIRFCCRPEITVFEI
jgi:uncharacterized protein